jgi:hypothetical protein
MGNYTFWLYWLAGWLLFCIVCVVIILLRRCVDDEVDELIKEVKRQRDLGVFDD